ncbi:MAG: M24 family metallopeptidase [Alphaproteobacteria bacterium]|nr:M24 family metallopeptidase [Alphaproteobacteria bacterium]
MQDPAAHLEAFEAAQRGALDLLRDLTPRIEAGMTEHDVHALAHERGEALGFSTWFRAPIVRFAAPATVSWTDRPSARRTLDAGMIVELEVAPGTPDAFGNAGTAFVFGGSTDPDVQATVDSAAELCRACVGFSSRWKCVGEVFVFAEAWANNRTASLGGQTSVGFQAIPPTAAMLGVWPGGAWGLSLLRRNQVQYFNPRRMNGIYVLRPRFVKDGRGASFSEMVYVTPDAKHILGRGGIEDVARL